MLGKGILLIWIIVGYGPAVLAVGAVRVGGCLDIFSLISYFSLPSSLWETTQYRRKYSLKGPLNPKQPTPFSMQQSNLSLHCLLKPNCP